MSVLLKSVPLNSLPIFMPPILVELMEQCWSLDQTARPEFHEIETEKRELLHETRKNVWKLHAVHSS